MVPEPALETERLTMRRWTEADVEPFAAINADRSVMEHFPSTLTHDQTRQMVARIEEGFDQHGFGLWALELQTDRTFVGFCGLAAPTFEAHFTPAVEVGWRLAREHWGNGYATEAAAGAMSFGFGDGALDEIVSFTIPANARSIAVMIRLGMTRDPADDFDHPRFAENDRIRRHVLYRMGLDRWAELQAG